MFKRLIILLAAIALSPAAASALPSVSNVTAYDNAGLYEKFEATFDVTTVATNAYWPYDAAPAANTSAHPNAVPAGTGVSVDGLFLPPGQSNWNNAIVQPGFYYQDFVRNDSVLTNGTWLYPSGNPRWKVRFAPTSLGQWRFKIRVTDSSGTLTDGEHTFTCNTSSNHGFVRVSPNDSRYFELSDGTYVPLIGMACDPSSLKKIEDTYQSYNQKGINLVRAWWQSSSAGLPLYGAGGQGGDTAWCNLAYSNAEVMPGKLASAVVPNETDMFRGLYTQPSVKPFTNYRLTAMIKTVGITGTGDYGVRLHAWAWPTDSERLKGDNDWRLLVLDFRSIDYYYTTVTLGMQNVTGGSAYCAEMSLKENLGGGQFGPELLVKRRDFQVHTNVPQDIAWKIDQQLDTAKQYGVYVKAVIEEKQDSFLSSIQPNGTWGPTGDNNLYAWTDHACRTYQTYYWRYLIARYGYSTALHSLELFNEADPFNGNHHAAVDALGAYLNRYDPNKHLASTSNWHSFPPAMWTQPSVGSADLHMYLGWNIASGGNRIWPGWDGIWSEQNTANTPGDYFSFDNTVAHSGSWSVKLTQPPSGTIDMSASGYCNSALACQVGTAPGHTLRFSMWAKGQGIGDQRTGRPQLYLNYLGMANDWVTFAVAEGQFQVPIGTYDWQQVSVTTTVPAGARVLMVNIRTANNVNSSTGTAWIDDVRIEDLTDGRVLNYNGGFEYQDPESYDVVAGHCAYSHLARSFGFGKPTIRGETALCYPRRFTDTYKGFKYMGTSNQPGEDQLLVDDTNGVWWRKWVWAHTDPDGLIEIYWWPTLIDARNFTYAKAYQNFMAGIPLSNGHYQDVAATVDNPILRVLGQKDLVNNRAHLWIDNSKDTWKNVVDGVAIPTVTGAKVTVTGLANGPYTVEWWSTSTGSSTTTEQYTCAGGSIQLSVPNLQDDIACKIRPAAAQPPTGSVTINSGAASTNSTSVALTPSAVDNGGGIGPMRFSNDGANWSAWEPYQTSKAWSLLPGDGSKTVSVQLSDLTNNPSPVYQSTILLDTTQPQCTISINSGAPYTSSSATTLALSASDTGSGVSSMHFSNDGTTWSSWEPFITSRAWTLASGDGVATVRVQFRDAAGNASLPRAANIVLDTASPSGSVSINAGAASVNTTSATLTLSATDGGSGVSSMQFSNDGSTWSTLEPYGSTKSWTLTAGDGTKTIYARFKDGAGNVSAPVTDTIVLVTSQLTGTVAINSGAAYTNSTGVSLTLSASGSPAQMQFSNDGATWTNWESYGTTKSWILAAGDGTKTVYVRLQDSIGGISSPFSSTIALDASPPSGSIVINSGALFTNNSSVTLTVSAADPVSGVSQMRFSNDAANWTGWEPYATAKPWTLLPGDGTKTMYAQFSDGAGNLSSPCSAAILVDTVPPAGSLSLRNGSPFTNSVSVTLSLSATDSATRVSKMRFSSDGNAWSAWESYSALKAWTLTSGDGTKDVYAQFQDAAGNSSAACSFSVLLDTSIPTGSMSINSGDAQTSSADLTLALSASDTGSGVSGMSFSNDGSTWSAWEPLASSKLWTIPSGDGTKTVYARFQDSAGNVSTPYSGVIVLDTSLPAGSLVIDSAASYANSAQVSLTVSAAANAIQMRFSNDGTPWSDWESYNTSKAWTLISGDGPKTVYVQFRDAIGGISAPSSAAITLDTSIPSGAVVINSGAAYVNTTSATLTLSATDTGSGASGMRFSNDGISWSAWQAYNTTKSWTLTSGDGSKTVYAQFRDGAGNLSITCMSSTALDTVSPMGSVVINAGAAYATTTAVTLALSASDTGGGVSSMRFSNNGTTWSGWESYGTSKLWTLTSGDGTKTVSVQFKDGAGNVCATCTDTLVLDATAPTGSVSINGGAARTSTLSVTLTLSAADGGSGVSQARYSNDGSTWTAWEAYATTRSWTLTPGYATKTVYVQFKDVAGNASATCNHAIALDAPSSSSITINSGAAYTSTSAVSLSLSGGDAAAQMRFSNDGVMWSLWEAYSTTKSWTLTSGDGTKIVSVQFKDSLGGTSTPNSNSIIVDTSLPTGSVTINSGAAYTNAASVTLGFTAADTGSGVSSVRLSNDGTNWSNWDVYAATKSWTLASGEGLKRVYAQFSDGVGNYSTVRTNTIFLDATAPSGSIVVNGGAAYSNSTSVTLTVSATDAGSSVAGARFSNDGISWSSWGSYTATKPWNLTSGDGAKTVYVQFKDQAANISQSYTTTIALATSGPTGTVSINSDADYALSTSVTLTVSANGPAPITQMQFSNDGTSWSEWETYQATESWSVTDGDGAKTVYARFMDAAGNVSATYSDTIVLQTSTLTVEITGPTTAPTYRTNHPSLVIGGVASDSVTSLTWSTESGDSGDCTGTTSWTTAEIPFSVGLNVITVTATDTDGSTSTDSITVEYVDAKIPAAWTGLMMVSVPVIPDVTDPKLAVGFDQNSWCVFNTLSNTYTAYGSDPNQVTWFIPPERTPGRGFWAFLGADVKTPLGTIPPQDQPVSIHLYPGWNIIGQPFISPVRWDISAMTVCPKGGVPDSLDQSLDIMDDYAMGWNQTSGAYSIVYDSSIDPGVKDTLDPWMAYWVKAYVECDLIIPPPQ